MLRYAAILHLFLLVSATFPQRLFSQTLKSVVYDFDGFNLGASDIPEGDYSYGDLTYQVSTTPPGTEDMLGDRSLRLDVNWSAGYAAFGRGISRYIELDPAGDFINFYFFNPAMNNQNAEIEIAIYDDDNQNKVFEDQLDDKFVRAISIPTSQNWKKFSIPLNSFTDDNTGGNGQLELGFGTKGMLLVLEFRFSRIGNPQNNASFFIDMICFSEGPLPTGSSEFDLPPRQPQDHCLLGSHEPIANGQHQLIAQNFESYFSNPEAKKIRYVNTYMQFSQTSTSTANGYPGTAIQQVINNGYRPVITWEPMFLPLAPLNPAQPKLADIVNGVFDTYIDNFADIIAGYSDTVIIRLMHEFNGDWYPWCISQNNQNPALFIQAWQYIVNRFKTKGVPNVQWMWCPNNEYAPYEPYNWFVQAYPGDAFVDLVSTDVYNGNYPYNAPWWRSFRSQLAESYYYLLKHFPSKPLIICELGARERGPSEPAGSESKAGWYARMDKELQSNFRKVRGLIFFNAVTGALYDWRVNSSANSLQSLQTNIWNDNYYFGTSSIVPLASQSDRSDRSDPFYPNPATEVLHFPNPARQASLYNSEGKLILRNVNVTSLDLSNIPAGMYFVNTDEITDKIIIEN